MPAVFCKHKTRTVFIDWLQWSFRYEMLYIYRFLGLSLNVRPTNWCALQQNRVNIPGGVFSSHLLCLSIFSLPSSMNSLKVQLVLSSPTTELPRGCGRSASSITPSSGKNRSALMVGGFFVFDGHQSKPNTSLCTASLGTVARATAMVTVALLVNLTYILI